MTDPQLGRRYRVRWIEPPSLPDDETIERLRQILRLLPNVRGAYVVAQLNTPEDGALPFESVGVALVLEPPLKHEPRDVAISQVSEMTEKLRESGFGHKNHQAWLFVDQATIDARRDLVVPIYP